jgi:hypothetical protein
MDWKLNDWRFPEYYREVIKETVEKAMHCGTSDLGYARYECLGCEGNPKPVFVCFTCKSRFCHRCGKKYTDDWSDKQQEMILDVPHRHMVFTIPKELRNVFFEDRKKLNELSKQVAEVFQYHYQKRRKKDNLTVGVITVIHTFGRDLKFNPHIHALVTEGALDNRNQWVSSGYIPYDFLRKSWQKVILDLLKKWFPDNQRVTNLVNELYQRYPKGFYVNAEKKMNDAKGAAKYIGRYLARPAIAEYRVEEYDGKVVRFWYEDHQKGKRVDKTLPVFEFLFMLIQHIKIEMKEKMSPEEIVQWATGGVNYLPEPSVHKVLLIPQYIYRPWNIEADIEGTKVFYYPVANESISPNDRYMPNNFLVQKHKALGDEVRLRIVKMLSEVDRSLQDITEHLDMGKSTVHHHLKILRAAKIVEIKESKYSLKANVLELLFKELDRYLKQ